MTNTEKGSAFDDFKRGDQWLEVLSVDCHFKIGKFPQTRIHHVGRTTPHKQASAVAHDQGDETSLRNDRSRRRHWKILHPFLKPGEAVPSQRTGRTFGLARKTDQRA